MAPAKEANRLWQQSSMFIVDLIPITKIPYPLPQLLSYFYKEQLPRGALVGAAIGQRKFVGVVVGSTPLVERKLELKKSGFELKGISQVLDPKPIVSQYYFEMAQWLSNEYLTPLGLALRQWLPKAIVAKKKSRRFALPEINLKKLKAPRPVLVWQKNPWLYLKKEIGKTVKTKQRVLIIAPELEMVAEWKERAGKHFPKSDIIVGSKSALFLPHKELGLIILLNEENEAYLPWGKEPRYDVREVAEKLAQIHCAQLILSTRLPSLSSWRKIKTHLYNLFSTTERSMVLKPVEVVDMRQERQAGHKSVLSFKLYQALTKTLLDKSRALLFINRRGMATTLMCQECAYVKRCSKCDVPMVFHMEAQSPKPKVQNGQAIMVCHHCGATEPPPTICPYCRGYMLRFFGQGTQKIKYELAKLFPKIPLFILDADHTPADKAQKTLLAQFAKEKTGVLIATQLILKYQNYFEGKGQPALLGILSLDQMLNLPEFRARERTFQLLTRLANFANKMFIQTFDPDNELLKFFQNGQPKEFLEQELKLREQFNYPPFSEIIRLSYRHRHEPKARQTTEVMAKTIHNGLQMKPSLNLCASQGIELLGPVPGFIPKVKGRYLWHIIIKCSECDSAKQQIKQLITPQWKIEVNPETLL